MDREMVTMTDTDMIYWRLLYVCIQSSNQMGRSPLSELSPLPADVIADFCRIF